MDLCRIDSITHIMTFTVCYICDQAFRFSEGFADNLNDIDIFHFVVSAYIVDFANTSFVDDKVDCFTMVFYIEPVTHVKTFAVNRKRFVVQCISNHKRNKLFREVIRSVVIRTTGNCYRQSVCSVVSKYK